VSESSALSSAKAAPPPPRGSQSDPRGTSPLRGEEARLSDLREWMAHHGLEAGYVTSPVSIAYLTGFRADPHERLMALAVRAGAATLVVPALERERAASNSEQAAVLVA
jgi:Xaa-Pro aminopeptidase